MAVVAASLVVLVTAPAFHRGPSRLRMSTVTSTREQLLNLVEQDLESTARGSRVSLETKAELDRLVTLLESAGPKDPKRLLPGSWQLLYTLRSNTGLEDVEWIQYLFGANACGRLAAPSGRTRPHGARPGAQAARPLLSSAL